MNNYLFYSNYDILQVYALNDIDTPKFVISAPNEIRTWLYNKDKNVVYIICLSGLYKINLDEDMLFVSNDDQQYSGTLDPDEDGIFIKLEDKISLDLFKVEAPPINVRKLTDDYQILKYPNIFRVNGYGSLILVTFQNSDNFNLNIFDEKHLICNSSEKLLLTFPQTTHSTTCANSEQIKVFLIISTNFDFSQNLSENIVIPQKLFIDIFSKESDQVQSPVILFCRQDGHVFYSFVKHDLMKLSKHCETLCDIGNNIINIVFINVVFCETNSAENKSESLYDANPSKELPALVVISSSGKLLLYFKLNSKKCWYSSVINGPVLDACCESDMYLYHTNGNYVYQSKFYYIESENRLEAESTILHDVKVKNIQISTMDSQYGCCLVCQTFKNTILQLTCNVPTQPSISGDLKIILLGIDQKRLQLEDISLKEKHLNSLIQQINIAANLMISKSLGNNLISCDIKIESDLVGVSQEFFLLTKLTNESKCKLSSNWSVILHLQTSGQSEVNSHSVSLNQGLDPGQSFKIKFPTFSNSKILKLFLILNAESMHKDLTPQNLCVHIFGCNFDSLDFLLGEEDCSYIKKPEDNLIGNKIYNAQLNLTSKQIHLSFSDLEKVKLTPDVILQLVLSSKRKGKWRIQDGVCRLFNESGDMVSISCQLIKADGNENYVIHINSNSCQLLASVNSAISRNLKETVPSSLESISSTERHKYIRKLQEIKADIEEIKLRLKQNPIEENQKLMFSIYEKLRKTQL